MSYPISHPVQTTGINDIYEYNEIHLDSNSRDTGTNDAPVFTLRPGFQGVLGIKVVSAQIPFSYYVFNDNNNTFLLTDNLALGPTTSTVSLLQGNYTATTLATQLSQALTAASGTATYTVVYSSIAGKFLISSSVAEAFSLTFGGVGDLGHDNPRLWLGFPGGSTSADAAGQLMSPNVVSVTGPNYLILTGSPAGRISKNMRVNGSSSIEPAILAKIPVSVNPWGVVHYVDPTEAHAFDMSEGLLQQISLGLQFGDSRHPVHLNGAPWSITLQVLTERSTSVSQFTAPEGGSVLRVPSKRVRIER